MRSFAANPIAEFRMKKTVEEAGDGFRVGSASRLPCSASRGILPPAGKRARSGNFRRRVGRDAHPTQDPSPGSVPLIRGNGIATRTAGENTSPLPPLGKAPRPGHHRRCDRAGLLPAMVGANRLGVFANASRRAPGRCLLRRGVRILSCRSFRLEFGSWSLEFF